MTSSPKRILFVATEAAFFVTHRLPLALAARARGYDVHVATPRGRLLETIHAQGFPWHEVTMRRKTVLWREMFAIPDLMRLYVRLRPDLVHHIAIKAVLYGTVAARLTRVPAVVNAITGLGYAFEARSARSLLGRGVALAFQHLLHHRRLKVIFQNVEDRALFEERGWISPDDAVVIRGSGVDTDLYVPAESPPDGVPLVVFASRLLISKGVEDFVAAARIIRGEGVAARFAIAGEVDPDNPQTHTAAEVEAWKNEGVVEVWGRRDDMPEILRQAAIFVLPTRYREGVPKAVIEAASTGLAPVTTDVPGCRDIVSHGETGLLVPPHNPVALAGAIAELLGDPARRRQMGTRARQRVIDHFSLGQVIRETMGVYEEMLGVVSGPGRALDRAEK